MDKLSHYRHVVKKILTEYDCYVSSSPNSDSKALLLPAEREHCLVFDEERDQYLWLRLGWQGKKRVKGINIHLRIKNEKIWIEEDWTEDGVVTELINAGIPHHDIVLAFYPPEERNLTEFAIV
jgi:hypothetical protein